jgi:hypothetical protein
MGWAGLDNGELLVRAEEDFDVFITVDRNLTFQQNLPKFDIAVVVLRARTNRLKDLIPLVPKTLDALNTPAAGQGCVHRRVVSKFTPSVKVPPVPTSMRHASRAAIDSFLGNFLRAEI